MHNSDKSIQMRRFEQVLPDPDIDNVMPSLPAPDAPVSPGLGDVTPALPSDDASISPNFPGDVTPMLPAPDAPVSPGLGDLGDVTPMLPSNQRPNIGVTVVPIVPSLIRYGYIRFFNAAPSAGPVDIYVNGKLVAAGLAYLEFTEYMRAIPGYYRTVVYPAGQTYRPYLSVGINISANTIYTAVFDGTNTNLDMELITDRSRTKNYNTAYMRFIHLSPNSPAVDIYVDNNRVVSNIAYEEVSNYIPLRPGVHTMTIKLAGTNQTLLEDPYVSLKGGNFYATYIVGYSNGTPGLTVVIPLEGTTYLKF